MSREQKARRQTVHADRIAAKRAARAAAREQRAAEQAAREELSRFAAIVSLESVGERLGVPAERVNEFAVRVFSGPLVATTGHWAADIVHNVLNARDEILGTPALDRSDDAIVTEAEVESIIRGRE